TVVATSLCSSEESPGVKEKDVSVTDEANRLKAKLFFVILKLESRPK
ncbi:hypothetical protein L917_21309, partial [Phytophthora nicotianae]